MATVALAREFGDSDSGTGPTLVFHRAAREGIRYPDDVVALLDAERVKTGMLRARNPITHDQWWIPVMEAAKVARRRHSGLAQGTKGPTGQIAGPRSRRCHAII
jgi:hypothetical protein